MDLFDAVMIGGGPGGYLTAERASQMLVQLRVTDARHRSAESRSVSSKIQNKGRDGSGMLPVKWADKK